MSTLKVVLHVDLKNIMSFFYLTAVKGDIPVHLLEEIAIQRLRYLKGILKEESIEYNEYLIEGSIYDNIGHFILCIVTILCGDVEFRKCFIKAERDLFKRRITSINGYDLRCFSKKLLRSIRKQPTTPTHVDALKTLCEHLIIKDLAQHVCSPNHASECSTHSVKLHFKHCLPFIAKRQVELHNGIASVPCGKWKQFMNILFSTNLSQRLINTNLSSLGMDPRLSNLLVKLSKEITTMTSRNYSSNVLFSRNVDNESSFFPPCMLNLHQQLRKKHRLSHTQRFHYSLFLKDIGMPIEEAIDFWRFEYQQAPHGSHSCCHSWEKDEKKYLYGIRHMYGLEGCRKNYASVNCQRIQSVDNACSEGGCPFKVFETSRMNEILNLHSNEALTSQINELRLRHQYTSACILYLQTKHMEGGTNCDMGNVSFNFTPVKYYANVLKKMNC